MIGNSSSGLVEAPSFRLPVVNIGIRQDRRIRGNNVIDVGYSVPEIVAAIKKALSREFVTGIQVCKNPYGTGKTGMKIARILGECEINSGILQKRLAY
jgi:UDP-N-acetylglucosamine 2-epimerase (non-hydrolysing)/GDP/UDP-N,N'-diacetylbacillosamine 2-epimerase (hydrolysing)